MDEAFTWMSARVGERMTAADLFENLHGPLYTWLLHLWTRFAGDGEWALRLPSALMGVGLVLAMAWLARRVLGAESVLPAAWLAAGSPFLIWYSQEARNYTMLMLCAALATGIVLAPSARGRGRALSAYLGASWAGLMSNLGFALLLPLHLRAGWRAWGARARGPVLIAAATLAVLALPWVSPLARTLAWERLLPGAAPAGATDLLRGGPAFHAAALPYTWLTFSAGYSLGPGLRELHRAPALSTARRYWLELGLAALGFGALTVSGILAMAARGRLADLALWLLLPALLLSYLALCNFKPFNPRYLAVSVPGYLLLLAAGWQRLPRAPRWAVTALVAALWSLALGRHYFDPAYGKEDFRSVAATLRAEGRPGERVLAAGAQEPLFYYYRGPLPVARYWLGFAAEPARMRARFAEVLGEAPGAWVVLSRPEQWDAGGRFAAWIQGTWPHARRVEAAGVTLWHLERPAQGWGGAP